MYYTPTLLADDWANLVGISPTTVLQENHLCYTDGRDLACDDVSTTLITNSTISATSFIGDGSNLTGITAATSALTDLTDVNAPTPSAQQALIWDGTQWVADNISISIANCASGYTEIEGSCFKLSDSSMNHTAARSHCQASGGYLAIVDSSTKQSAIESLVGEYTAYIGLDDLANEGTFEWVDGSPISYNNWNSGEPNNSKGNEDCTTTNSSYWNDITCTNSYRFICENPSASTSLGSDNLGNHSANQTLIMNNNDITGARNISAAGSIQAGSADVTCSSAADDGRMRYNSVTKKYSFCRWP